MSKEGGVNLKIFISYSRKDEAVAHLLAYILREKKIECLIDRELRAGDKFDSRLQQMIRESDLLLILLSKNAANSAWVNQEIGFATAHGKLIWPISIDKNIQPYGMFSTSQSYSLFDWSDPHQAVERLVKALLSTSLKTANQFKQLGFDHIIEGKIERTRFIADRLRELLNEKARRLVILNQAAFSIFCASDDQMYRESGGHSPEYMKLLLEERQALDELVRMPNCTLKMILWPVRAYEDKYLAVRYANLLSWMEGVKDDATIDYVCAQYPGPNRLIVMGEFMVEGFKLHQHAGYEMTVVKYQAKQIEESVAEFNQTYVRAGGDKAAAIQLVSQMYENVSQLVVRRE